MLHPLQLRHIKGISFTYLHSPVQRTRLNFRRNIAVLTVTVPLLISVLMSDWFYSYILCPCEEYNLAHAQ